MNIEETASSITAVEKDTRIQPEETNDLIPERETKPVIHCSESIKKELDEQQLAAVEAPIGNTCVFAVAGSGKTRTLTYRVANLIDNGIPEDEILLLTFTNKAADEMEKRICDVLIKKRLNLTSGTFHSVASRILRKYAKEIGYTNKFKIITPGIQRSLIDACRTEYLESYMAGFNNEEFPAKNVIADIYSGAINHNLSFREYINEFYPYFRGEMPDGIILILKDYVKRKDKEGLMDFDDLLLNFMDLLSLDGPRKDITQKYRYIFVDEYQDINWIQYQILEKLNTYDNMFVIGDAKQCIYQFRGSKPEYIDMFMSTHNDVNPFSLTYNYRSSPEILKVAEEVIFYNDPHNRVIMNTKNPPAGLPFIFGCDDEKQEVQKIAEFIRKHNMDLKETAILVRRGAQISIVEKTMKRAGIPYNLVGSVSMYETEHIQDIIAFLQLINSRDNEAAFLRVVSLFRGIGPKISSEMYHNLESTKFDYITAAKISSGLQNQVLAMLSKIIYNSYKDISVMIQAIMNSFYMNYAKNRYPDFQDRMEDIRYLVATSKEYEDLTDFLDDVSTMKKQERTKGGDCLTIITMHKSKGLEWDNVFIPFIDKKEWPRCRDKEYLLNNNNIKNERNLFYVAVTRARKKLYLSYSLYYTEKPAGPSPFLEEIDGDAYDAEFLGNKKEGDEADGGEDN